MHGESPATADTTVVHDVAIVGFGPVGRLLSLLLGRFGTDYPFEDMATATNFLRTAPISETDRRKAAAGNAEALLRL